MQDSYSKLKPFALALEALIGPIALSLAGSHFVHLCQASPRNGSSWMEPRTPDWAAVANGVTGADALEGVCKSSLLAIRLLNAEVTGRHGPTSLSRRTGIRCRSFWECMGR